MKKLLCISLLFCASIVSGQDRKNSFTGGLKFGIGMSSLAEIEKKDTALNISESPIASLIIGFRLISKLAKQWQLITDLSFSGKGGGYPRASGNRYTGQPNNNNTLGAHTGFCPSLQLNFTYKTKPEGNSFIFGGGPFFDANKKNAVGIGFSSGPNLLAGYRFFTGISIEVNFKKDLFYKKRTDEALGPYYKNTSYGLCLAYEF